MTLGETTKANERGIEQTHGGYSVKPAVSPRTSCRSLGFGRNKIMRKLGYFLLIAGFLATTFLCVIVSAKTHALWIWNRNDLSEKQVTADLASDAIREVTLKANGMVRQTFLPALAMLVGGLMIGIEKRKNKPNQTSDGICQPCGLPKPSM